MLGSVHRTEQIWVEPSDLLADLCHSSKNLYNKANFLIRQAFFQTSQWLRYQALWALLKTSEVYKALPAQTAQQTLKILDQNWKAFFITMKAWKKDPEKFHGRPCLPGYKRKDGEFLLAFTNQQARLRDGWLVLPRRVGLKVQTRLNNVQLNQVRIIPKGIGYCLEIIYTKELEIRKGKAPDSSRVTSIDLGVRNLVTLVTNIGERPIVVKGGIVKSINQYYNKCKAHFQSIADRQGLKTSHRLQRLSLRRNGKIKDYFHKLSRRIVEWCVQHNIGTIVIGYNERWK